MGKLNLSSKTDSTSRIATLTLAGYLDAETVPDLMKVFKDLFAKGFYRILVDMKNLEYIASTGVSVLLSNIEKAREKEGDIILLNPAHRVSKVFTLLGLQEVLKIVKDKKTALEKLDPSFKTPPAKEL